MMVATFNGNPRATINSCNSPTKVSEETELDAFYDELTSLVRSVPKHKVLVIGSDTNAQIGKNVNHKNSQHNSSNRNWQHLIDFTIENIFACLNTNYQKRERKLWAYTYAHSKKSPDRLRLYKHEMENSAINCEACVRALNFHGKNTTESTKKYHSNNDHHTLWLDPS